MSPSPLITRPLLILACVISWGSLHAQSKPVLAQAGRGPAQETHDKSPAKSSETAKYSLGLGYTSLNISNANGLTDILSGKAGSGPYLAFAYELTPRHVFEANLGAFTNKAQLADTRTTGLLVQWNFFWVPTFYSDLGLAYLSSQSDLVQPGISPASYKTTKLYAYAGLGHRWKIWRLHLSLEYLSMAYVASSLNESFAITDPALLQLYRDDEEQANGSLILFRTLNFQLAYNF